MLGLLLLATLVTIVLPEQAHAYQFDSYGNPLQNGKVCGKGIGPNQDKGLTRRVVPCVKETIITAVNNFLVPFSQFMASTVKAMCLLSIAIGGIWVASGRAQAALKDMSILFIKIIFVTIMTWNFGGMFGWFLDIMDQMLAITGQYALSMSSLTYNSNCPAFSNAGLSLLIWEQVDCLIETLIGSVFSPFTLAFGIAGFLMGAILSTTVGVFIALLGFYIVMQVLFAVAKAMYIFISAYIAFSFMVLISPIFIPCIVLRVTKPYFDKWLRLTISFMLQPMIVFAYLSMLMVAADITIFTGENSVYRVLAGDAVDTPGFELGAYLVQAGVYREEPMGGQAVGINPRKVLNDLGAPTPADSGVAGDIGNIAVKGTGAWTQDGIYNYLGIGNGNSDLRFFKVDWPVNAVDWTRLAFLRDGTCPPSPANDPAPQPNPNPENNTSTDCWTVDENWEIDPTPYMIRLMVSFFMAAVVAYIFLTMLDSLPFLSAGIAGVPAGMPTLGHGTIAPPGSNLMDSFKAKMEGLVSGAK